MEMRQFTRSRFAKGLMAMVMAVQLAACVEDDDNVTDAAAQGDELGTIASEVVLSGSVGDGPVTGATILVYTNTGSLIGSMTSSSAASFQQTFKVKGRDYPLLLEVEGGIDLVTGSVPDFQMVSVMMNPSDKQVNINPFSTLIVKIAESLPGGITSSNISLARDFVIDKLGFGLDLNLMPDPITAEITDQNVASLVKSSEALGEMVRRTRDRISVTGTVLSGDDVVVAIAADMTDGMLNGAGADGAVPRIAAVANVVAAQVLVEAMSNNLKVGGVVATSVIDQAIMITNDQISSSRLTGSVRLTQGMLNQARVALAASQVLDASEPVIDVTNKVKGITADALPDEVATVLPYESSFALDYAVMSSPIADETQISAINEVVASGVVADTAATNTPPVFSGVPAGSVVAGSGYGFQPLATDADGDVLSFSIANQPGWAAFDAATGYLGGTPSDADVGSHDNIVISVTDGIDTVSLAPFSIRVDEAVVPNTAPTISGSPAGSVVAGSGYVFQPVAADVDGDALLFSIASQPGWADFDAASGRLSGTPDNTDTGTYDNIVVSVTDGTDTASLASFSIRVDEVVVPNPAPTISGSPAGAVVAGTGYVFQPAAADADGDTLTFSIANKPGWASFSASSGRLSGTPDNGDAGTYGNIRISVSEGTDSASLTAFSVTVEAANTAPTISGSPAGSVDAGSGYVFQPTAADADGDALSFSIANKPGWASFDTATGRLSGTPADADVGVYSGTVISVTDGEATTSMAAFDIEVFAPQVQTGSLSLSWTAPVTRADGSPLSLADINGYRVYYGDSTGSYPASVDVPDGTATATIVSDLPAGDYYVVMTTYDVDGRESGYSSEILKPAQ